MSQTMSEVPTIPRMRSLFNSFKFVVNPIPYIEESIEEFGDTYKMYMGGMVKGIVTRDPLFIQHVLRNNHRGYEKSKLQTKTVAKYVGQGLLTSTGDYWLRQRRLIQPGFHKNRLKALVGIMNKVIDKTIGHMEQLAQENKTADIDHLMMELTFGVVAKTLFNTNSNEEELKQLGDNITAIQKFIIK